MSTQSFHKNDTGTIWDISTTHVLLCSGPSARHGRKARTLCPLHRDLVLSWWLRPRHLYSFVKHFLGVRALDDANLDPVRWNAMYAGMPEIPSDFVAPDVGMGEVLGCWCVRSARNPAPVGVFDFIRGVCRLRTTLSGWQVGIAG